MNINLKTVQQKVMPVLMSLISQVKFVFAVVLALVYGFLIVRIGLLSKSEPNIDAVDGALLEIKRPRIDKDAVAKIYELRDQNIQVQTFFQQARENPFSE